MTAIEHLKAKPIAGSVVAGLLASLCCGGSLIFASIGLGVFYSTLGLSRFVPEALAAGALSIVAINYLYYRQMVKKGGARPIALQQKMFISTAIGLAVMAGSFIFMEWLNHAVVHGDRFLTRAEYSQAFIKGVPNITLLYVCATFFVIALLWALPLAPLTWLRVALLFLTHERRISMSKLLASAVIAVIVLASSTALAAEKTITPAVKNMYCADCPFIVRKSLEAVPGVSKAVVSYKDKTAVVTYDDTRADVAALTRATTEAGYPSAPRS